MSLKEVLGSLKEISGRIVRAAPRALFAIAALGLAACASTGGPLGLTPAQEKAIGEQQHPQILAAFGGEVDDPQLKAYVQRVFDRLIAASDQPDAQIKLTVLDSPVVNAMALPGHVYVTRGLLALSNSEAELAGVLGHEIGHIFQRHIAKRVSRGNLSQLGAVAVAILTGDQDTAQLAGQAAQLYLLNYSRDQEFESDQVGVRLLARANYDPVAQADFLNTLGSWSNLELQIAGVQRPPEYLSSHPNSAARVRRAAQEANVLQQGGAQNAGRNRNVYLNAIDGIIYGDDPITQGFVRGRDFVHPSIGFAFTAPSGFELRNSSQAVTARSSSGAQMQFSGASSQEGPDALINGAISQSLKIDLSPAQRITVNGRRGAVGQARANTRNGQVDVTAYAIQWQVATNYIFLWVTPANQTRQLQSAMNRTVQSLRTVDARSANAPAARRVDVVTVQPGDTVERLSGYMAFPNYKTERFQIMNGFQNGARLEPGERAKLVR
ncbi:MAG: M48 family metalloprotease [Pseudomonadota bacterium]